LSYTADNSDVFFYKLFLASVLFFITDICEFSGSAFKFSKTCVVDVIKENAEPPRGLAVKLAAVYVARRWSQEVEVYKTGTEMSVNTRKTFCLASSWRPDDLIASFTDNVIYLLGWVASNEQVVLTLSCDTGEILSSWPVVKMPRRLSVDASNSLLMACQDGLRSYSSFGLLKSVIPITVDVGTVWHAVQLPTHVSCSGLNRFAVILCINSHNCFLSFVQYMSAMF